MKRRLRNVLSFVFAVLLLAAMTACSQGDSAEEGEKTAEAAVTEQIKVIINDGENVIAEKEIKIEKGNNLLDIMKENFDVEETNLFINSIEGVMQNEQENKYWVFEINGEPIMEGAHLTEVKNNDEVVFELQDFS